MTRSILLAIGAVAICIGVALSGSPVLILKSTEVFTFFVAFAGLHVLSGRLGLISVGHGAFIGIGALGAAHAIDDLGVPYLLAPLAAAIAAAVFGSALAIPALRLPGPYLALLTLAMAMALPILMRRIDGPLGVRVGGDLLPPEWTGIPVGNEEVWQFIMVVVVGVAVMAFMALLLSGRFGRELFAVRDNAMAAAAFGIHVKRVRVLGVGLASALAGAAGGLLVYATPYVAGEQYPFELSLSMFALVVAFGADRLWSSVPSAIVLVMLPEVLRVAELPEYEPIIYGLLLLVMSRLTGGRDLFDVLRDAWGTADTRRRPSAIEPGSTPGVVLIDPDVEV